MAKTMGGPADAIAGQGKGAAGAPLGHVPAGGFDT